MALASILNAAEQSAEGCLVKGNWLTEKNFGKSSCVAVSASTSGVASPLCIVESSRKGREGLLRLQ